MAVLAHFFEIAAKPNQPPILLFRRVVRRMVRRVVRRVVHRMVFIFCAHIGKLYDPKKMENYMIQKKNENLYGYNHWAYIWIYKICRLMENYMFFQLKVRLNIHIIQNRKIVVAWHSRKTGNR